MTKIIKKGLIIFTILLTLFLVIGSISASEDVSENISVETYDANTDINVENQNNLNSDTKKLSSNENNDSKVSSLDFNSITKEYSSENTIYTVKVYDKLNYEGKEYKEPRYNASVKLRVYTGSNYKDYTGITDYKRYDFKLPVLSIGTYNLEIFVDNEKRGSSFIKINKNSPSVSAPTVTVKYKKASYFYVTILDEYDDPVKSLSLKLKVYTGKKSKTYTVKTNSKGIAKLKTSALALGTHKVTISSGNTNYYISTSSKIIVKKTLPNTKVTAPTVTVKYKKASYFYVTVLNSKNKPVKSLSLKLKVYTGKKSKTYTVKTNSKGIAKLKTSKLSAGTHKVNIKSSNRNHKFSKNSKIIINKTLIEAPKLISVQYYPKDNEYYAKLVWNAKKGSTYQVLRKLNGKYGVHSTVVADSSEMVFYDKIGDNTLYTYSVRKIEQKNGKTINGLYDKEGLKLIKNPEVKVDFQNLKATITWNKVSGATKYLIFRKLDSNHEFKCIASVGKDCLSYVDNYYKSTDELTSIMNSNVFIDASYNSLFYTVRACKVTTTNGAKKSYGLYLKDGDFNLESPAIISLKENKITWGSIPNAEGYLVLKNNGIDKTWEIIGQADKKSSTTISLDIDTIDKNAYYAIQGYANKNGELSYSNYDRGFTLKYFSDDYTNQRILYFGDSITYGSPYGSVATRHIFSIPYRVAELLGCVYYNPSIPGSTYHDLGQKEDGTNIENTNYYRYRICREVVDQISDGKLPGNWKSLDNDKNSEGITNTTIDQYNIVVLAAGTNDYLDDSVLGSIDSNDVSTFNGALNHILEKIENASEKRVERGEDPIKVVFVDLYYSDRTTGYKKLHNRDVTPNNLGLTLQDYQKALDNQLAKWDAKTDNLTFYNFDTRSYNIVNQTNCPYTSSDNLHFTKFIYGQYGEAFAQFLVDNVF